MRLMVKSALKLIEELQPDIAILDIKMPHYSGLDIAKICRDREVQEPRLSLSLLKKMKSITDDAKSLNVYGYMF